jgi:hypothetical protein
MIEAFFAPHACGLNSGTVLYFEYLSASLDLAFRTVGWEVQQNP